MSNSVLPTPISIPVGFVGNWQPNAAEYGTLLPSSPGVSLVDGQYVIVITAKDWQNEPPQAANENSICPLNQVSAPAIAPAAEAPAAK